MASGDTDETAVARVYIIQWVKNLNQTIMHDECMIETQPRAEQGFQDLNGRGISQDLHKNRIELEERKLAGFFRAFNVLEQANHPVNHALRKHGRIDYKASQVEFIHFFRRHNPTISFQVSPDDRFCS